MGVVHYCPLLFFEAHVNKMDNTNGQRKWTTQMDNTNVQRKWTTQMDIIWATIFHEKKTKTESFGVHVGVNRRIYHVI